MMAVSVIVPNYNHARFLNERIDSILAQTYPHFELILLDDASSDGSQTIIEQYSHHSKVKAIIFNEKNSGSPFRQWKKGMEAASHDWIWIAESDDTSEPEFLEICMTQLENNPTAATVMTQTNWIDEKGQSWFSRKTPFETEGLKKGTDILKDYFIYENPVKNASAVVFSKKLLTTKEVETISQYQWCGDWALWCMLCSRADLYFINQPLNHYRRHGHEASRDLYYRGYLYKEGLAVALHYQQLLKAGLTRQVKALYEWSHHLFEQYRSNAKQKRSRLYLFTPLYYCVLMHLTLPLVGIQKLTNKIFRKRQA